MIKKGRTHPDGSGGGTGIELYLLQPEQQPQRSGWRRCYRRPSDTVPPKQPKSQSAPTRYQKHTDPHLINL